MRSRRPPPTAANREVLSLADGPYVSGCESIAGADRTQRIHPRRDGLVELLTVRADNTATAQRRTTVWAPIEWIRSAASRNWVLVISARLSRRSASCWLGVTTVGFDSRPWSSASPSVSSSVFNRLSPHIGYFAVEVRRHARGQAPADHQPFGCRQPFLDSGLQLLQFLRRHGRTLFVQFDRQALLVRYRQIGAGFVRDGDDPHSCSRACPDTSASSSRPRPRPSGWRRFRRRTHAERTRH